MAGLETLVKAADKANTVVGLYAVDLTKHIMEREGLQLDSPYRKLYSTELYKLLANPETRLFLEDEDYYRKAYGTELSSGVEALYVFMRPE